MDNEYGTMFKRLMNERNELRKYIIDICKSLDIDTSQSILGVNCLEFYAVLCSTAENKIGDLQEQLKRKEQECEHWKNQCLCLDDEYVTVQITQEQFEEYCQNKQALDEIAQAINNFPFKEIQDISQTQIECTSYFLSVSEAKLQKILDIISKAKRGGDDK